MNIDNENSGYGEVTAARINTQRKPVTVWLVDDCNDFRRVLANLLAGTGEIQCPRQFGCAEAVLQALATETAPDLILLDNHMPGMWGMDAIRPIRQVARSTRVVMLTTYFDAEQRDRALRDGASDIMLKCRPVDEIARGVQEAFSRPIPAPTISVPVVDLSGENSDRPLPVRVRKKRPRAKALLRSVSAPLVRGFEHLCTSVARRFERPAATMP